jgi:hypothetical protein
MYDGKQQRSEPQSGGRVRGGSEARGRSVRRLAVRFRHGRGGSVLSAAAWAVLGFLSGAVFWHMVGFWGFLSEVVLRADVEERGRIEEPRPAGEVRGAGVSPLRAVAPGRRSVAPAEVANCSAAGISRGSGIATVESCRADAGPWPTPARGRVPRREDLAIAPSEPPPQPLPPAAVQGRSDASVAGWSQGLSLRRSASD